MASRNYFVFNVSTRLFCVLLVNFYHDVYCPFGRKMFALVYANMDHFWAFFGRQNISFTEVQNITELSNQIQTTVKKEDKVEGYQIIRLRKLIKNYETHNVFLRRGQNSPR